MQHPEVSGAVRAIECPRKNVPDLGRVFLMLKYTDITQKHLSPKLNGYGDNGQRSLKL